jgi:16S rRNA (cytosine1402-N4)-methyltransferase
MVSEISAVISTGSAASGRNAAVAFRFARAASRLQWSRAMTAPEPPRSQSPSRHVPVLLRQVIQYLAPHDDGVYVDGTYGAGGYSAALLAAADTRVIGIDRDPTAIAAGAAQVAAAGGRLVLVAGRFGALDEIVTVQGIASVDGVVLDLGVSSMQLDTPQRGFSFRQDGPLDMRMGGDGPSAADVVAAASERDLADIIFLLGEERHARAVARAIVAARREQPIDTTLALAGIVARVVRGRPGDIHPATRTFQALRLFVNEELRELVEGLSAAERILKPGGRLVVVSFHSLEDRIVKTFFAARSGTGGGSRHLPEAVQVPATFNVLTRRPVIPDDAEVRDNPRARSAKLRAGERTAAPVATAPTPALPRLPTLADVMGR